MPHQFKKVSSYDNSIIHRKCIKLNKTDKKSIPKIKIDLKYNLTNQQLNQYHVGFIIKYMYRWNRFIKSRGMQ